MLAFLGHVLLPPDFFTGLGTFTGSSIISLGINSYCKGRELLIIS